MEEKDCLRYEADGTEQVKIQRDLAAKFRTLDVGLGPEESANVDDLTGLAPVCEAQASTICIDEIIQGPGAVARKLATEAGLNKDQLRLVALFAWPMQQKWDKRLSDDPQLADSTSAKWANDTEEKELLPHVGMIARILFVGGGGSGKSRIINRVLTPPLKTFYGSKGLMIEAASNKAARGVGGITLHAANKLLGSFSLMTVHLRTKPRQQAAMNRFGLLGAKLFDEVSQINSKLFHADAYCTAVGRSGKDGVTVERYADLEQTWGALPIVGVGGDELQLPPVPMQAGLFAPIEGTSHEQKTAVEILNTFTHVYRLTTACPLYTSDAADAMHS